MTDALERLKRRQRPTVPARDASLTSTPLQAPTHLDTLTSGYQAEQTPTNTDTSKSEGLEQQTATTPAIDNMPEFKQVASSTPKTVGSVDTQTSRNLEVFASTSPTIPTSSNPEAETALQTKQSTLRLEQGVSDRLQTLTRREGLCREVLIEAMFEYCEAHPEVMQAVLEKSKAKNEFRQQVANMKRAQSMMQRFGNAG